MPLPLYGSHGKPFLNIRRPWLSQSKRFPTPGLENRAIKIMTGTNYQQGRGFVRLPMYKICNVRILYSNV